MVPQAVMRVCSKGENREIGKSPLTDALFAFQHEQLIPQMER